VLQLDEPRRLYAAPACPFAAYFLGRINFLRGEVAGKSGGAYHVALAGGTTARVPLDAAAPDLRDGIAAGGTPAVVLAVRPEHLRVAAAPAPPGQNALAGRVVREKFVGTAVQLSVTVPGGAELLVEGSAGGDVAAPGTGTPAAGTDVTLSWDPGVTLMYPWEADPELGL